MKAHRKALVALVAVLAGVCAVHAAPAKKPASVKWPGGQVSADGQIGFKTRGGKVLLNFAKNVRATAQGAGQSVELHHADQATAEVDSKWQFDTLKATGNVRFTISRKNGEQLEKTTARCNQVTIYNRFAQELTGDQRVLIAELSAMHLTMPAPGGGAPTEPMTGGRACGAHRRVWDHYGNRGCASRHDAARGRGSCQSPDQDEG